MWQGDLRGPPMLADPGSRGCPRRDRCSQRASARALRAAPHQNFQATRAGPARGRLLRLSGFHGALFHQRALRAQRCGLGDRRQPLGPAAAVHLRSRRRTPLGRRPRPGLEPARPLRAVPPADHLERTVRVARRFTPSGSESPPRLTTCRRMSAALSCRARRLIVHPWKAPTRRRSMDAMPTDRIRLDPISPATGPGRQPATFQGYVMLIAAAGVWQR